MITVSVLNQRYPCRTRDRLWYREIKTAINKILAGDLTTADIGKASLDENIFNASSTSRSKEIAQAVTRRINAVDSAYLSFFVGRNTSAAALHCDGHADRSFFSGIYGYGLSGKADSA